MTQDDFRTIESALGFTHAAMATALGVSEVTVKRYATGTTIPGHAARLAVALILMQQEGLQMKFAKLRARYHCDT